MHTLHTSHIHAYTPHTHARTCPHLRRAHTHIHIHAQGTQNIPHTHVYTCRHHMHMHTTHLCTHVHMYAVHTYTCTPHTCATHRHTHVLMCTTIYMHAHTYTHVPIHTTHMCMHMNTCACAQCTRIHITHTHISHTYFTSMSFFPTLQKTHLEKHKILELSTPFLPGEVALHSDMRLHNLRLNSKYPKFTSKCGQHKNGFWFKCTRSPQV